MLFLSDDFLVVDCTSLAVAPIVRWTSQRIKIKLVKSDIVKPD